MASSCTSGGLEKLGEVSWGWPGSWMEFPSLKMVKTLWEVRPCFDGERSGDAGFIAGLDLSQPQQFCDPVISSWLFTAFTFLT